MAAHGGAIAAESAAGRTRFVLTFRARRQPDTVQA